MTMRIVLAVFAILVGVCAGGNLLRGLETLLLGAHPGEAAFPLVIGAVASLAFVRLLQRVREAGKPTRRPIVGLGLSRESDPGGQGAQDG